ncbi:MAG: hypothetical protein GX265_03830 [Mollicutes bacterium]|nr:hypothetical protein [Mollicutes bacterium]
MMKSFSLRLEKSKKGVSLSLDNFTNDYRNKLKKLERNLNARNKSLYMPLGSNTIMQSNIKDDFYYDISTLSLNEKFLLALEYVYELEGICLISTVGNDIFKSKDIQELLLCYTIYFSEEEIENLDITELEKFIAVASQIRYLCRSYKKAKKFFFDNFQEELHKENSSLKAKVNEMKINNKNLIDVNNTTNQRLEELSKENNRLKAQLEEEKANKKELIALREYIFNNSEENTDAAIDDYYDNVDIDYIDNTKGVIIGGKPNWLLKMRNKLPSWTLIDPSSINFDKNILNNEHVFINTSYISHAMYYKVVENLGKNSNIHYINNTNIEICLEEIYNIIR